MMMITRSFLGPLLLLGVVLAAALLVAAIPVVEVVASSAGGDLLASGSILSVARKRQQQQQFDSNNHDSNNNHGFITNSQSTRRRLQSQNQQQAQQQQPKPKGNYWTAPGGSVTNTFALPKANAYQAVPAQGGEGQGQRPSKPTHLGGNNGGPMVVLPMRVGEYRGPPPKTPKPSKSGKSPKSPKSGPSKGSNGSSVIGAADGVKVVGTKVPKGGGHPTKGVNGQYEENSETTSYEYDSDKLGRTLSVVAFQYTTNDGSGSSLTPLASTFTGSSADSIRPTSDNYNELVDVTREVLMDMFRYAYAQDTTSEFLDVEIENYEAFLSPQNSASHNTKLMEYKVTIVFRKEGIIPSLFQLEGVAEQGLQEQGEYYHYYVEMLRGLPSSNIFSTTTHIHFIGNANALQQAIEEARESGEGSSGEGTTLVSIVAPAVALGLGFAAAAGFLTWYFFNPKITICGGNAQNQVIDEYGAIKGKDSGDDDVATTACSTLYTRATTSNCSSTYQLRSEGLGGIAESDTMSSGPDHDDDDDSSSEGSIAAASYLDDDDDYSEDSRSRNYHSRHDFDEVSLDDPDVDFKDNVGEIKKSYVGDYDTDAAGGNKNNAAEVNLSKHIGEMPQVNLSKHVGEIQKPVVTEPVAQQQTQQPQSSNQLSTEQLQALLQQLQVAVQDQPQQQEQSPPSSQVDEAQIAAEAVEAARATGPISIESAMEKLDKLADSHEQNLPIWATPILRPVTGGETTPKATYYFKPAASKPPPPKQPVIVKPPVASMRTSSPPKPEVFSNLIPHKKTEPLQASSLPVRPSPPPKKPPKEEAVISKPQPPAVTAPKHTPTRALSPEQSAELRRAVSPTTQHRSPALSPPSGVRRAVSPSASIHDVADVAFQAAAIARSRALSPARSDTTVKKTNATTTTTAMEKKPTEPSGTAPAASPQDEEDEEKSVMTIDSQSSQTPEFLKRFKQMGLTATRSTGQEQEGGGTDDESQSIMTIDSQSSATPEFMKKFKTMGLKRYKDDE